MVMMIPMVMVISRHVFDMCDAVQWNLEWQSTSVTEKLSAELVSRENPDLIKLAGNELHPPRSRPSTHLHMREGSCTHTAST